MARRTGLQDSTCGNPHCRYRQLYEDSQRSLNELIGNHREAVVRREDLRQGVLDTLKRLRPDRFAAAERQLGGPLAEVGDELLVGFLAEMLMDRPRGSGLSALRTALEDAGFDVPASDDLADWAATVSRARDAGLAGSDRPASDLPTPPPAHPAQPAPFPPSAAGGLFPPRGQAAPFAPPAQPAAPTPPAPDRTSAPPAGPLPPAPWELPPGTDDPDGDVPFPTETQPAPAPAGTAPATDRPPPPDEPEAAEDAMPERPPDAPPPAQPDNGPQEAAGSEDASPGTPATPAVAADDHTPQPEASGPAQAPPAPMASPPQTTASASTSEGVQPSRKVGLEGLFDGGGDRLRPSVGAPRTGRKKPAPPAASTARADAPDAGATVDVEAAVRGLLTADRPVFLADVAEAVGEVAAANWEQRTRDQGADAKVRFIAAKRHHQQRGALVLPIDLADEADPAAASDWMQCVIALRGQVLYEVGVALHRWDGLRRFNLSVDEHVLSLRLDDPLKGMVGVVVALSGDHREGGALRTAVSTQVERMFAEQLTAVAVLAVAERHIEPLADALADEAAARAWRAPMPLLTGSLWEYSGGGSGQSVPLAAA